MGLFRRNRKKGQQATNAPLPRDEKPRGAVAPSASTSQTSRGGGVSRVLSGEVLGSPRFKRLYPFLLYCSLLILLYMSFVFQGQRVQREEIEYRIELQRLRARSLIYSSERLEATRHGNIQDEITKRGIKIKEWPTPPHVISNNEQNAER